MPLSPEKIAELINFNRNQTIRYERPEPFFNKTATLQILNAVTEQKKITDDCEWVIKYSVYKNRPRFFVRPRIGMLPCGSFDLADALRKLEL